jgi:hypothetical protein
MLKSSSLQKRNFDITRRGGHETYRIRPEGSGASSRTASQPSDNSEIARLVSASKGAIAALDQAEASGSPTAIGAAKAELRTIMAKLESAKADALYTAAVTKALGRPFKMGE